MAKDDVQDDEVLDDFEDETEDEDEVEDEADDEAEDDESESDSEDDAAAKPKTDKSEKRIRDLQSQLDKAKAENNKLLKAKEADSDPKAKETDPEVRRWVQAAKDVTRSRVYDSDPRFKEFGIDQTAITGDSPEEMNASAAALLRIIKRIESRTTNKVLREHGFSPEPRNGDRAVKRDYRNMKQDEFDALVKQVVGG